VHRVPVHAPARAEAPGVRQAAEQGPRAFPAGEAAPMVPAKRRGKQAAAPAPGLAPLQGLALR